MSKIFWGRHSSGRSKDPGGSFREVKAWRGGGRAFEKGQAGEAAASAPGAARDLSAAGEAGLGKLCVHLSNRFRVRLPRRTRCHPRAPDTRTPHRAQPVLTGLRANRVHRSGSPGPVHLRPRGPAGSGRRGRRGEAERAALTVRRFLFFNLRARVHCTNARVTALTASR